MPVSKFSCLLLSFLIFLLLLPSIAGAENYCNYIESWKEWDELLFDSPNDMELHTLHALRIGLCVKVDRRQITVEQATDIFESARETIIKKRDEDNKQGQDRQKL